MDLSQKIPPYITEKKNITRLIFFTAFFALVFINIYDPFEVNTLIEKALKALNVENIELMLLLTSSLIILTGVLVVVISRIILFQITKRRGPITLLQYMVWIAAEVVSMAMFYAMYERLFFNDPRSFYNAFKISIQNTALIILLPYSISWLYFSWIEKNKTLERMKEEGSSPEGRREMIIFHDEKGTMRLSIKFSDLLYLQAADNYVNIVYNNQEKISKYMLRSSLKLIEDTHTVFPLIRCHRSYMVNFEKVKIIRREKEGLRLEMDAPVVQEIPVSKSYIEDVFSAFGHDVE